MGLLAVQPRSNAVAVRFDAGTKPTSIPFDLFNGKILIRVSVNGSPPATYILDTGAGVDVISLRTATAARLALRPSADGLAGIGARQPELHVATDTLTFRLPGVVVSDAQVFAMPLDGVQDCLVLAAKQAHGSAPPPIEGFLGAPFFRSLVVEIDYGARQLHLYNPSSFAYKGRGRSVPIEMDEMYTYVFASVALPGRRAARAKLVVDTGAGALSLTKQFAAAHGVLPAASTMMPGAECGSGGLASAPTLVGTIDRLQVGPFTLRHPLTAFYEATAERSYDGLLGADALQHFTVIFDYVHRRMILEPIGSGPSAK